MNYQYGNKKQWRRWVWNRLAERAPNRRDGLVLFLAGESALDVPEATRRGFRAANMLAVERDTEVRKKLRDGGVLTIDGDFCSVLLNWPTSKAVSVVQADFCCGLEWRVSQTFLELAFHPAFANTAFALNVLRGRERPGNRLIGREAQLQGVDDKHRGSLFWRVYSAGLCGGDIDIDSNRSEGEICAILDRRMPHLERLAIPAFYAYRSAAGHQVFDCVTWRNPIGALMSQSDELQQAMRSAQRAKPLPAGIEQRRRTAAVLAHHTRRQSDAAV